MEHEKRPHDFRIVFYRIIKQLIIILSIGIAVKVFLFDSVRVDGDQMSPTIISGDQTLLFNLPYFSFTSGIFPVSIGKPLVFNLPFKSKESGCLRVSGKSGDSISIDSGKVYNSRHPSFKFPFKKDNSILPVNYSPRDFFVPYYIPKRNDLLFLDTLPLRDLFFAASIIQQENPRKKVILKPQLIIEDSVKTNYMIDNFSLYKGLFDTIPEKYMRDWFFWDRLIDYLQAEMADRAFDLKFRISLDSYQLSTYQVRKKYIFLLADNWGYGLDSRYFGPVEESRIRGRVFFVIWSYNSSSGKGFAHNRFGKIIR
jgi:signal peptidase I